MFIFARYITTKYTAEKLMSQKINTTYPIRFPVHFLGKRNKSFTTLITVEILKIFNFI